MIQFDTIPAVLKDRKQWVLWKVIKRDGDETKVPFSVNGKPAKANDPTTWSQYVVACEKYDAGGFDGIGYEFSADDPYCGIDLDGCRNQATGEVAKWARVIIERLNTYAEISPSQSGIKLFIVGKLPCGGRKRSLDEPRVSDKAPAIEVYDRGRYFAVTGVRFGEQAELRAAQAELDDLLSEFWPAESSKPQESFYDNRQVIERARKYLLRMPPAVSGSGGHNATFRAACVLIQGFALERSEAMALLAEWNASCQPPWSERELEHKIGDAIKQPGERGYLRDARPEAWGSIRIPDYRQPEPKPMPKLVPLDEAASKFIDVLRAGKESLIITGIPDLDYAIGGGVERGEMVILAALPSHGKSLVALQCVHGWRELGLPCLIISEEMSAMTWGKRTLQHISDVPEEHWRNSLAMLESDLANYSERRAPALVAESCGTAETADAVIAHAVAEYGVQCVVVDYAQLLRSPGKSRYEQVTTTSTILRQAASKHQVLMFVLCHLSREINKRSDKFSPKMSDLKETGQFEQDADVILFSCWPHRMDQKNDPHAYQFFVLKNRNREIKRHAVECRIEPSRMSVKMPKPANYEQAFDEWNEPTEWHP